MRIPKVRPVEIRKDGKDFHLCKDERSGSSIDNPAGGLNIFWKHETKNQRNIRKKNNRRERRANNG